MAIKLSVIIPTRERHDVLAQCLRTVVDQVYPDCEIIVSDNYSNDRTKQVVGDFSDRRVKYINTGRRVSMAENWEFALQSARGEFVSYIGDDDGFVPGALAGAMDILERFKMNALVWKKVEYCWPDYIDPMRRNWMSLPNLGYGLRVYDGRRKLRQVMRSRDGYNTLPCLYNGIVRKSLIDGLKSNSTNGVFFNAMAPDVFSGIALSQVVGSYLYTHYPFSVNGASRHSIGTSYWLQKSGDLSGNPKATYISENLCIYDERLLMVSAIVTAVTGEYLQAKKFLPSLLLPEPDWDQYLRVLIKSAKSSLFPDEILASATHTAKRCGLGRRVPDQIAPAKVSPRVGFAGESFNFTVPLNMVNNVYDACRLVGGMLPAPYTLRVVSPAGMFVKRMRETLIVELKAFYRSRC